jgi:hypothetical protein
VAADGSHGPRPFTQRRVSTVFLRVPARDWPAVKRGYKSDVPQLFGVNPPAPVVAYSIRNGRYDAQMMVLEAIWQEPLGAISPESLEREGFKTFAEFRTYWLERERKRFRPTRQVFAYRVRPWAPQDADTLAGRMFSHLYGEFLDHDGRPLEVSA